VRIQSLAADAAPGRLAKAGMYSLDSVRRPIRLNVGGRMGSGARSNNKYITNFFLRGGDADAKALGRLAQDASLHDTYAKTGYAKLPAPADSLQQICSALEILSGSRRPDNALIA
jgi:hypothetical protein